LLMCKKKGDGVSQKECLRETSFTRALLGLSSYFTYFTNFTYFTLSLLYSCAKEKRWWIVSRSASARPKLSIF
jgi:hypothetical protein